MFFKRIFVLKKAFLTNSSGILCSRVFGFLRDLSMANILGAGVYSDIFFVAFKFPNLFRRIFGEGAFTQSFLPSFIASSKKGAFSVLVLLLFSCALIGFSLLVVAFSGAFTKVLALGFDDELIKLASPIVAIHFWYLFLVFLVTFFSTLLQYKQHFWVSAYNTALLNIAMICALLFARGSDELAIVYIASYGVLVGGVAQIALHIYPLYKLGFMRLFVCGVRELRVAGVGRVLFGKKLDSSGRDSVLGSHSADFGDLETTADLMSSSAPKSPKNYESNTATPRILEEDNQSSSRADEVGVAIHNQNADSSLEAMDCHATATAASRNDRKNTIGEKVDSSNAHNVSKPQAEGFCDDFVGCQGVGEGIYLSGNEQAHAADSRKSAQKPTPKPSKAESTNQKPTPKAAKLASTIRSELGRFFKQFLPAMLGSSTAQIASFIDTILASFLASGAISYLYYANRIFQLPLAIFAIAISTALFPMVAKAIKANEHQKALIAMKKAFWFLLFMLLFCAVGGIMLREQIIWLLYEHGKFSRADTLECAMVFAGYMVGLVPFGCARIFSLYLYSRSQQALAAKISAISLLVGVVFSLVLMQFLGAFGLALAGSLSGFVLFALTIRAFGFGEFWAIICARNYALLLGFMLVCEVLLLALWLHYIQIPH
ncbi:integral membrane protein MviN [Helicobacter canis NCTC 12740]|uniref:Probable lipid II flippase MurJ n=1 Tax=Helicobacter canis NCTC 12740 TaxID=1357399 RepID=V8CHE2_9HELI|nr:integral membrane protein MviN [Helicobacter canis NCTC 12740]